MSSVRQTFDSSYAERAPLFGPGPADLVTAAVSELPEGARVLDLGAGDGRNSLHLLEKGFEVHAVDFAESGIRYLREQAAERGLAAGLTAEVSDIRDSRFGRHEFDGILLITVLENLPKQDQLAVMDRLRPACRDGGVMAVEAHSYRDPAASGADESDDRRVTEFGDTIVAPLGRNELIGYFHSWRILDYYDVVFEDTSHGEPHDHGRVGILAQSLGRL